MGCFFVFHPTRMAPMSTKSRQKEEAQTRTTAENECRAHTWAKMVASSKAQGRHPTVLAMASTVRR